MTFAPNPMQCRNHSARRVWNTRTGYCEDCDWSLRLLEQELRLCLDPQQPVVNRQRRFFFLCPRRKHGFTSRCSGADSICRKCKDIRYKSSVASEGHEDNWPSLAEVGPTVSFERPALARGLVVRVDPNVLDLQKRKVDLQRSLNAERLDACVHVSRNVREAFRSAPPSPCESEILNELFQRFPEAVQQETQTLSSLFSESSFVSFRAKPMRTLHIMISRWFSGCLRRWTASWKLVPLQSAWLATEPSLYSTKQQP